MAAARYREAQLSTWDKSNPGNAQVIVRTPKAGLTQIFHDALMASNYDWQGLAQVTRDRPRSKEYWARRCLP